MTFISCMVCENLLELLSEKDQSWIRRSSRTYVNNKLIISHRLWWQKCSRGKSLIWNTLSVLAVTSISSASVVSVVAVIVIVSLGSSLAFSTPAVGPFEVKLMLLARFGNRTPEDRYILFHILFHQISSVIFRFVQWTDVPLITPSLPLLTMFISRPDCSSVTMDSERYEGRPCRSGTLQW